MTSNQRFFLAAFAFFGLLPVAAHAGRPNVPCQAPFVFPDAAVNVVVLPYRESGLPQRQGKGSGAELSLLIQMDVLSHILDHGSVGAVQLEASTPAEQGDCRPEIVGNKLLGKTPGAETTVSLGRGLVLVWGVLYEEDEDLYVQTFVSFLRRDRSEDLTLSVDDDKFTTRPSSQKIAFAPRRMSVGDLKKLTSHSRKRTCFTPSRRMMLRENLLVFQPNVWGAARVRQDSWWKEGPGSGSTSPEEIPTVPRQRAGSILAWGSRALHSMV